MILSKRVKRGFIMRAHLFINVNTGQSVLGKATKRPAFPVHRSFLGVCWLCQSSKYSEQWETVKRLSVSRIVCGCGCSSVSVASVCERSERTEATETN